MVGAIQPTRRWLAALVAGVLVWGCFRPMRREVSRVARW